MTNGLDANKPVWNWWSAPKADTLEPYDRGVAYIGASDEIFVQAGGSSTTTLESLVIFKTSNEWRNGKTLFYQNQNLGN